MEFRFPNESDEYRVVRNQLLKAELELRRGIEEVAALGRKLPLGGKSSEDFAFETGPGDLTDEKTVRTVRLSELFASGNDTLALYNYMFGPKMEKPCSNCTSFLDSLDRAARDATQRVNLAVVAKSPIHRIRAFARTRGWRRLRLLSS